MERSFYSPCWHLAEPSRAGAVAEGRGAALGQGRGPSASLTYIANVPRQGRRQPPRALQPYRLTFDSILLINLPPTVIAIEFTCLIYISA